MSFRSEAALSVSPRDRARSRSVATTTAREAISTRPRSSLGDFAIAARSRSASLPAHPRRAAKASAGGGSERSLRVEDDEGAASALTGGFFFFFFAASAFEGWIAI